MPEKSVFLKELSLPFPIPLLAFEILFEGMPTVDTDSQDQIIECFTEALVKGCGLSDPSEDALNYFNSRVTEMQAEFEEDSKEPFRPGKAGFYSDFVQYASEQSTSVSALLTTNFDYEKAKHLYCTVDRDSALTIIREYFTYSSHMGRMQLEACVYGFGGEMQGASSEKAKVFDINSAEAKQSLKNMGF